MLFFKAVTLNEVRAGDRVKCQDGVHTVLEVIYAGPEYGSYVHLANGDIAHFPTDAVVNVVDEAGTKTILERYTRDPRRQSTG